MKSFYKPLLNSKLKRASLYWAKENAISKASVGRYSPKTKTTLIKWFRRECARLPTEHAEHVVAGIKQRVLSVMRAEGDSTQYRNNVCLTKNAYT